MTNSPKKITKSGLRTQIRKALKSISTTATHTHSADIISHLTETISQLDEVHTIATFASTPIEPDLHTLHHTLQDIDLIYPLCHAQGVLTFHKVKSFKTLIKGRYGILQPDPDVHPLIEPADIDIILCPAYAYNKNGERLGKGGGYYDRYLAKLTPKTLLKIGVIFDEQLLNSIPTDDHDIPVDMIITENRVIDLIER